MNFFKMEIGAITETKFLYYEHNNIERTSIQETAKKKIYS